MRYAPDHYRRGSLWQGVVECAPYPERVPALALVNETRIGSDKRAGQWRRFLLMERLSKQQYLVLRFVRAHYPVTSRDIEQGLGLARSSVHYTTHRLLEKGVLETGLRPANGRTAAWSPSPVAKWAVHEYGVGL